MGDFYLASGLRFSEHVRLHPFVLPNGMSVGTYCRLRVRMENNNGGQAHASVTYLPFRDLDNGGQVNAFVVPGGMSVGDGLPFPASMANNNVDLDNGGQASDEDDDGDESDHSEWDEYSRPEHGDGNDDKENTSVVPAGVSVGNYLRLDASMANNNGDLDNGCQASDETGDGDERGHGELDDYYSSEHEDGYDKENASVVPAGVSVGNYLRLPTSMANNNGGQASDEACGGEEREHGELDDYYSSELEDGYDDEENAPHDNDLDLQTNHGDSNQDYNQHLSDVSLNNHIWSIQGQLGALDPQLDRDTNDLWLANGIWLSEHVRLYPFVPPDGMSIGTYYRLRVRMENNNGGQASASVVPDGMSVGDYLPFPTSMANNNVDLDNGGQASDEDGDGDECGHREWGEYYRPEHGDGNHKENAPYGNDFDLQTNHGGSNQDYTSSSLNQQLHDVSLNNHIWTIQGQLGTLDPQLDRHTNDLWLANGMKLSEHVRLHPFVPPDGMSIGTYYRLRVRMENNNGGQADASVVPDGMSVGDCLPFPTSMANINGGQASDEAGDDDERGHGEWDDYYSSEHEDEYDDTEEAPHDNGLDLRTNHGGSNQDPASNSLNQQLSDVSLNNHIWSIQGQLGAFDPQLDRDTNDLCLANGIWLSEHVRLHPFVPPDGMSIGTYYRLRVRMENNNRGQANDQAGDDGERGHGEWDEYYRPEHEDGIDHENAPHGNDLDLQTNHGDSNQDYTSSSLNQQLRDVSLNRTEGQLETLDPQIDSVSESTESCGSEASTISEFDDELQSSDESSQDESSGIGRPKRKWTEAFSNQDRCKVIRTEGGCNDDGSAQDRGRGIDEENPLTETIRSYLRAQTSFSSQYVYPLNLRISTVKRRLGDGALLDLRAHTTQYSLVQQNQWIAISQDVSVSSSAIVPSQPTTPSRLQEEAWGDKVDGEILCRTADTPSNADFDKFRSLDFQLRFENLFTTSPDALPSPLPQFNWANSKDVWKNMVKKEQTFQRDPGMFRNHPELQPRMRSILLDWLSEVCEVYRLHKETFTLCIDFIDRYLSVTQDVAKTQLQLTGISALFIAAKLEEIYPPKLQEFAYVTDSACSESDIVRQEMIMLKALKWDLSPMTTNAWLGIFLQMANLDRIRDYEFGFVFPQFSSHAFIQISRLCDLCLMDSGSLKFRHSVIAAAAMYHHTNEQLVMEVSSFNWADLYPCVKWMAPFAKAILEVGQSPIKFFPHVNAEDCHNIQTHNVDMPLVDRAQALQASFLEKEKVCPSSLDLSAQLVCLLTPQNPHSARQPSGGDNDGPNNGNNSPDNGNDSGS